MIIMIGVKDAKLLESVLSIVIERQYVDNMGFNGEEFQDMQKIQYNIQKEIRDQL